MIQSSSLYFYIVCVCVCVCVCVSEKFVRGGGLQKFDHTQTQTHKITLCFWLWAHEFVFVLCMFV
jgi:hypothetical protein